MNIDRVQVGNTTYPIGLPNIYINSKGNFNIETSADLGNTSKGKINIEAMDDIQFKPGDDIIFYSHHRAIDKQNEVAIKVTDGDDVPVKLQINAANITLTTKDKPAGTKNESEILDLNINTGKSTGNSKGYLKVRARAIDLRCEEHGGIALQPKGRDHNGNMNKIKFEHGGGDGLEFGTFNTEHTSLFTEDYRFNRNALVKMATRVTIISDKEDFSDNTTAFKYVKQSDDLYDVIDETDEQTTWHDIIKTSYAGNFRIQDEFNAAPGIKVREMGATAKGHLQITTRQYNTSASEIFNPDIQLTSAGKTTITAKNDVEIKSDDQVQLDGREVELSATENVTFGTTPNVVFLTNKISKKAAFTSDGTQLCTAVLNNLSKTIYRNGSIVKIPLDILYTAPDTLYVPTSTSAKQVVYTDSAATIKPETDGRNYFVKNDTTVYIVEINSSAEAKKQPTSCTGTDYANVQFVDQNYSPLAEDVAIEPNSMIKGTSVSAEDIIKFISWAKENNQGPWA